MTKDITKEAAVAADNLPSMIGLMRSRVGVRASRARVHRGHVGGRALRCAFASALWAAGLWERYRERFRDRLVRFEPCAADPRVIGTKIYDPLDPKTDQLTSRQ